MLEVDLDQAILNAFRAIRLRKEGKGFNIPYLVGRPGGGKTMSIRYYAEKMGYGLLCYEPALERLEKFGGIPDLLHKDNELHTTWSVPEMICQIREMAKEKENVIVFFDDWHLCNADLQKIGFELFTYYSLNHHSIPSNVVFVLAGNTTSAAGAKVQLTAIRNRVMMLNVRSNPKVWADNYAIPNNLNSAGVTFLLNPDNIELFHQEESSSEQFGSPRSWTSAFNYLDDVEAHDPETPRSIVTAMVNGNVGDECGTKFMLYYDVYSKVRKEVQETFATGKVVLPDDGLKRFAWCGAIMDEFWKRMLEKDKTSVETFAKAIKELKSRGLSEYAVKLARLIAFKNNSHIKGTDVIKKMVDSKIIDNNDLREIAEVAKLLGG